MLLMKKEIHIKHGTTTWIEIERIQCKTLN